MSHLLLNASLVLLSLGLLLGLIRFLKGPYILDRAIVFDLIGIVMMGGAVIFSIQQEQPLFIDVALLIVLLSFIGNICVAYFWENSDD